MEGITVHKLNDKLVVSLYQLPGFKKLGTVQVRDKNGERSGLVEVFYTGGFFQWRLEAEVYEDIRKKILKLAQNYAIKNNLGVATTRFNPSTTIRERGKQLVAS